MLHKFRNAVFRSLVVDQPLDLPLGDPVALFRNEVTMLRFIYPLKLTDQHDRLLSARCFVGEGYSSFVLGKSDEIIVVSVEGLGAFVGMEPDSVFQHLIIEITCA